MKTNTHCIVCVAPFILAACASIDVKPLDAAGKKYADDADSGLRYYLPRPYLLVMRVPADPKTVTGGTTAQSDPPSESTAPNRPPVAADGRHTESAPGGTANGVGSHQTGGGGGMQTRTGDTGQQQSGASAAVASTQFSASSSTYVAKLIYLPDHSKPMAIKTTTGLGTVNLGAQLQEGWMLTSLQASSDSNTAAILTAIASAVTGKTSSGTGSGASTKTAGAPGGAPPTILPAGLYRFDFVDNAASRTYGSVSAICYVTLFEAAPVSTTFPVQVCPTL